MPHPFFGAKDVCYIEKKVAKKKAVLGQASLYHLLGVLCWLYPVGYPRIEIDLRQILIYDYA